jgi:amylosucrase
MPDAFEASLPEVFPDFAPGNFTWDDELSGWVWTTFNSWQWDLNWANPDVFHEFAEIVCFLANRGVECLRLDAIAFLWKRLGTNSQNQPEVHDLTQALRAVAAIAAPAVIFKAEAIVGPDDLLHYLGTGAHEGHVSDLAYHNSFMVQLWSALATSDSRLMVHALRRFPAKPSTTAWATYVRGHDDIGWAIDDADAAAVGWNGWLHRRFLSEWYSGAFAGTPARGLVFQSNPVTGDRRISGTAASLAGLEAALDSDRASRVEVDQAVRRVLLLHIAMLGFGGVPLIWMGDELALCNDAQWNTEGHSHDNRWVHRPRMPWTMIEEGLPPGSPADIVRCGLRHAVAVRSGQPSLHAATESQLLDTPDPALLVWLRPHAVEPLVAVHNLSASARSLPTSRLPTSGPLRDALTSEKVESAEIALAPYQVRWLVRA